MNDEQRAVCDVFIDTCPLFSSLPSGCNQKIVGNWAGGEEEFLAVSLIPAIRQTLKSVARGVCSAGNYLWGHGKKTFALPNLPGPKDANGKQLAWISCLQSG